MNKIIHIITTINMKPVDVVPSTDIDFNAENNDKDPKFEVGDHEKYQNIKTFLQKVTLQIGLKKFWVRLKSGKPYFRKINFQSMT